MATLNLEGLNPVDKDKKTVKLTNKEGGVLGLYFSAHWCPPCRSFTPVLKEFYQKVKEAQGDNFEIVFVSSDQDENQFNGYFGEMPWLAVAFTDEKRTNLGNKYGVQGIPTLVFVDMHTGKTISAKGRDIVKADENGQEFPWTD